MLTAEARLAREHDSGLRSPRSILIAQYSLLVSIGTGIASVSYFSISGPKDTINLVGNAINVVTVSRNHASGSVRTDVRPQLVFSAAYLVIHQITSWRYSQVAIRASRYRAEKLRIICLRVCALVVVLWIANTVIGAAAAAQAPLCEPEAKATSEWKSATGCRIQRASVAGSVMAV